MIDEVLKALEASVEAGGLLPALGRTTWTLYSNPGVVRSSILVFVFAEEGGAPRIVIKLSQQREALGRERDSLRMMGTIVPARVPRLLGSGEIRGLGFLALEGVDGGPMAPARFERHAGEVLAALADIHAVTRDGVLDPDSREEALVAPVREFVRWCSEEAPDLTGLARGLETALRRLGGVVLPRVAQHGDCFLGNILRAPDGRIVVVDWEDFGTVTVPGYDLTVLFATLARRSALEEAGLRRLMAVSLRRAGSLLALDERWLPVLVPLHLVLFLRFCRAERRQTPQRLALQQLRAWDRGAGRDFLAAVEG